MPNFQIGGVAMFDVRADPRRRPARADPRELLDEHRLVQVVAALPAVLGGVLQAEQSLRGELREDLVGKPAVALPLLRVGGQLALEEAADDARSSSCSSVNGGCGPPSANVADAASAYSPYERPITSSMISSVPAPMRFRRMSRHTRSTPYSRM